MISPDFLRDQIYFEQTPSIPFIFYIGKLDTVDGVVNIQYDTIKYGNQQKRSNMIVYSNGTGMLRGSDSEQTHDFLRDQI